MRSMLLCFTLCFFILMDAAEPDAAVFSEGDLIQVNFAPYIYHYSTNPRRNPYPWFTGLEWESSSRWEVGGAVFSNSYYQPCGYLYGGKRFILGSQEEHLFLKITAGVIFGYFPPYEDKIPVNKNGVGLGIIPALGYKYKRATAQIVILSTSALMLSFGYDLWN
jgi:hypothetical protein